MDNQIKPKISLASDSSLTSSVASLTKGNTATEGKNIKDKKSAGNFNIYWMIKYIYSITIFFIVLILIWVMSFLYNNVYLTMTQAQLVSDLKSKVIEESVDYLTFNRILEKLDNKKKLADWPYLNYLASPFLYGKKLPYPTNPLPLIASTTNSTSSPISIVTSTATTTAKVSTSTLKK